MKLLSISILISFFHLLSFGQAESNKVFEASKGKWLPPIPKYLKIEDNEERKSYHVNMFDSTLRILTDSAYYISAVHDGIIIGIFKIQNEYSVLVKFGDYYISYSGLTKPKLKNGEKILAGQKLGKLIKDSQEENYTLELMLTKDTKELSPKEWINW